MNPVYKAREKRTILEKKYGGACWYNWEFDG